MYGTCRAMDEVWPISRMSLFTLYLGMIPQIKKDPLAKAVRNPSSCTSGPVDTKSTKISALLLSPTHARNKSSYRATSQQTGILEVGRWWGDGKP